MKRVALGMAMRGGGDPTAMPKPKAVVPADVQKRLAEQKKKGQKTEYYTHQITVDKADAPGATAVYGVKVKKGTPAPKSRQSEKEFNSGGYTLAK